MTSVGIFASVPICAAVRFVAHGISIEMMPLMPDGIDERRLLGEEARLRMTHQHRALQLHAERGHLRPRRVRRCGSVELRSGIICL